MYMTLFCCLLFGFCHCWDFFYLFSGSGVGGEDFLKRKLLANPPPHFTPTNLFAFFFKKKKKRTKDKKPPPSPAVCTQALPRRASLSVRSHAVFVAT